PTAPARPRSGRPQARGPRKAAPGRRPPSYPRRSRAGSYSPSRGPESGAGRTGRRPAAAGPGTWSGRAGRRGRPPPVYQRNELRPVPDHPLRRLPRRGQVAQRLVLRDRVALFQPVGPEAAGMNAVRESQQETGGTSLLTPDGRVAPGGGTAPGRQTKV